MEQLACQYCTTEQDTFRSSTSVSRIGLAYLMQYNNLHYWLVTATRCLAYT